MQKFKSRARILQTLKQVLWECIGSALVALGVYNFAVQAEFPMTGFSGISIILYRFLSIPIGLSTILLNIPVAILCYRLLGGRFFVSSIRCMLLSSIFIDLQYLIVNHVIIFLCVLHLSFHFIICTLYLS